MSIQDRRERSIEQMLRGDRLTAVSGDACPDAETFAAWIEGSLTGVALTAAETHVAGCARCQALAATMVRTTPSSSPVASSGWSYWRLGWLVPATAAALAVGIWISLTSNRSSVAPATAPGASRVAEQPAAPSVLAAKQDAPTAPQNELKDEKQKRATRMDGVDRFEMPSRRPVEEPTSSPAAAAPPSTAASQTTDSVVPRGMMKAEARDELRVLQERPSPSYAESPDRSVRWRIVAPSGVQRSTDGGTSWETLSTGVSTELIAASAPSASVCWLVGREGTVLLSKDGQNWQRVPFPQIVDLSAVQASDDTTAVVTTVTGRRFRTADGGKSWVPS